ncbi:MAG TPA: VOC family protein [Gammaproteobacteria bacterium]|nr:VOC family protein [Gammaproteobacteria bacterium]
MQKPKPTTGMRHVALFVKHFEACVHFYTEILGMAIEWNPDENNIYLTSGTDNLALHRAPADFKPDKYQHLDHIGFFLAEREEVNTWFEYLKNQNVTIKALPKDHRDGSRSVYCADPDGNIIQLIYYPLVKKS